MMNVYKIKMTAHRLLFLLAFAVLLTPLCFAFTNPENGADSFEVSGIFSDNMVLQQNDPIIVFGTSEDERAYVYVRLGEACGYAMVENGEWTVTLPARSASPEKYSLEIYGSEQADYVVYENVSVGDVWLVIGQSNVEYKFGNMRNAQSIREGITGNENLGIFYLNSSDYKKAASENGFAFESKRWYKPSHPMTSNASALGVCLGLELIRIGENNTPVGIVSMGFAGQELACFVPEEQSEALSGYGDKSLIYNNFIAPFEKFPIRGVVWYQGEANAAYYAEYADGFENFINFFRKKKNQTVKNFPFYIVELSPGFDKPEGYTGDDWQYIDFGNVRAVTGTIPMRLENCYICATSDTWSDRSYSNNLHPENKSSIAARLAVMICSAEWKFAGYETSFAPTVKSIDKMDGDGKVYEITFDHVGSGLQWNGAEGLGFDIINESWGFANAKVFIADEATVRIEADEEVYMIRYGWNTSDVFGVDTALCNSGGVPAAAFAYDTVIRPVPIGEKVKIVLVKIIGFVYCNFVWFAMLGALLVAGIVYLTINKMKKKKKIKAEKDKMKGDGKETSKERSEEDKPAENDNTDI